MKVLKYIMIAGLMVSFCACSSTPKPNDYGGALTEIYRASVPQVEQFPETYHLVQHTCTSSPIYDINGSFVRSDVRCR